MTSLSAANHVVLPRRSDLGEMAHSLGLTSASDVVVRISIEPIAEMRCSTFEARAVGEWRLGFERPV